MATGFSNTASQPLVDLLSNQAATQGAASAYYTNTTPLPGGISYRRLLASTGFGANVSYVTPPPNNVDVGRNPRECTLIILHPYGLDKDQGILTSSDIEDRVFQSDDSLETRGLRLYAPNNDWVIPASTDLNTYDPNKTSSLIVALVNPQSGTSYHFIVDRRGNLIVNAAIDDQTTASPADIHPVCIDIAYESVLIAPFEQVGNPNITLVEAPVTTAQSFTLGDLIARLQYVFDGIPNTPRITDNSFMTSAGFTTQAAIDQYVTDATAFYTPGPFSTLGAPTAAIPFDYTNGSDFTTLFSFISDANAVINTYPNFQVFLPMTSTQEVDPRTIARTAIGTNDSLSYSSRVLSSYSRLAGVARSQSMRSRPRNAHFENAASDTGDTANTTAAEAGSIAAADQTAQQPPTVSLAGSSEYNFSTGKWGDGRIY